MRRNKEQNEPSVSRRNYAHSDRNIAKRGEDTRNQYKKSNWCKLNHERQTMFQALEPAELAEFLAGAEPLFVPRRITGLDSPRERLAAARSPSRKTIFNRFLTLSGRFATLVGQSRL